MRPATEIYTVDAIDQTPPRPYRLQSTMADRIRLRPYPVTRSNPSKMTIGDPRCIPSSSTQAQPHRLGSLDLHELLHPMAHDRRCEDHA